jgi:hypothetical protein
MDKVALLAELRALAADAPDFATYSPSSRLHLEWLGKAYALILRWNKNEAISFKTTANFLAIDLTRDMNVGKLLGTLHCAIADIEIQVPELPPQAFGPGAVYDFHKALLDLLASATSELLIVDPYLDEQIFDAYISTVPPQVVVRLLTLKYAASLSPAVQKFISQKKMTVEVRSTREIHDRVIFIDGRSCWVLGQSINVAAKTKPTYLAPLAADTSQLKKAEYERIWTVATSI